MMHVLKHLKYVFPAVILSGIVGVCNPASAGSVSSLDTLYADELNLIKGEISGVDVSGLTRVSVTDPDVADIVDATADELLILGKDVGQTALFVWDASGKRTVMVYVFKQDLDIVKNRIQRLVDAAGINGVHLSANTQEGKVVISGYVAEDKKDLFDQIVIEFHSDVINLVADEDIDDLIEIDMQITELNTTLTKSLGIDWTTGGTDGFAPAYEEDVPGFDGHIRDFFKIGHFSRTGQLIAQVNALITEGKARILSKPKLVVISGEEASFLVGGEVPIRTTTFSDTGSSQENVEFKEFGISMTITPTIKNEKVDIIMNLEVSEIDASTATTVSEDVAFSTRSASTHLYLEDAQTIILAGLIKQTDAETVSRLPFVSKVPVLGMLFRSKTRPADQDQELVIALTPHILYKNRQDVKGKEAKKVEQDLKSYPGQQTFSHTKPAPYYIGIPKEMTGYVRDVQQKISRSIQYPNEAQRFGWEGTVKLGMLILNDGTLAFALVKESSGHNVFDEVALSTAKQSAPFMAFPPDTDLQELNVTIPIVYSLGKN